MKFQFSKFVIDSETTNHKYSITPSALGVIALLGNTNWAHSQGGSNCSVLNESVAEIPIYYLPKQLNLKANTSDGLLLLYSKELKSCHVKYK